MKRSSDTRRTEAVEIDFSRLVHEYVAAREAEEARTATESARKRLAAA